VKRRIRNTENCLENYTEKRLEGRQILQGTGVRNRSLGQDWPRQKECKSVSCNFKRTNIPTWQRLWEVSLDHWLTKASQGITHSLCLLGKEQVILLRDFAYRVIKLLFFVFMALRPGL